MGHLFLDGEVVPRGEIPASICLSQPRQPTSWSPNHHPPIIPRRNEFRQTLKETALPESPQTQTGSHRAPHASAEFDHKPQGLPGTQEPWLQGRRCPLNLMLRSPPCALLGSLVAWLTLGSSSWSEQRREKVIPKGVAL